MTFRARNACSACYGIVLTLFAAAALTFAPFWNSGISAQTRNKEKTTSQLTLGTCDLTSAALPIEIEATAGVIGPVAYSSLQAAFAAINAGTHQGAINIEVCFNSAESTGSAVLNSNGATPASYTSVSIRPLVDGVTISGDSGSGRGFIELNGADSVTIDGDNLNTAGTNRDLTLQNTAAAATTNTAVVRIALNTTTVNTAGNNTFRNLNIVGSAVGQAALTATSSAANNTYGIFASGGASGATTAPSGFTSATTIGNGGSAANLAVQNNRITSCSRGAAMPGTGSNADMFTGLLIEDNTIGNPTAGDADGVYAAGFPINGFTSAAIRRNTIYVESALSTSMRGIDVNGVNINFGSGAIVEKNRVLRVHSRVGNNSAYGISITGGTGHTARNNFVANINAVMASGVLTTTTGIHGIRVATSGHQIYNNSVNLSGAVLGSTNFGTVSALTLTTSATSGIDLRNNILVNTMTGAPAGSPVVALFLPSLLAGSDLTINNNDYFTSNQLGQVGTAALSGYTIADFDPTVTTGATNWRNYTSTLASVNNDNASIKTDPFFASSTDLSLGATSPAADAGVTIASVVDDIDGTARPVAAAYDIGADERIIPSAAGATVAGRVVNASGNGIRGAVVMLANEQGMVRMAATSSFGYFRMDDVPTGATYIVTIGSKRYQFAPQVITLVDDLTELEFIGN